MSKLIVAQILDRATINLQLLRQQRRGPGFGIFDHCQHDMDAESVRVGKKAAGRLLDGVEHNGMPEVGHG